MNEKKKPKKGFIASIKRTIMGAPEMTEKQVKSNPFNLNAAKKRIIDRNAAMKKQMGKF